MIKTILNLLTGRNKGKSAIGGLAIELREAIKGKELDQMQYLKFKLRSMKLKHNIETYLLVVGVLLLVGYALLHLLITLLPFQLLKLYIQILNFLY